MNSTLAQEKVQFEGGYTADLAYNAVGGLDRGGAYLGNIDLTFLLETQNLGLWKGGRFFVYLLNNHGNSLSTLMGDLQVANNIEAESHSRLYEFWYEHQLNPQLSVLLGQHNLNSVFAVSDAGSFFVNSSFGIQPDISENVPTSIFPVATLAAVLSWKIKPNLVLYSAIYDGDPGSESENPNSINWRLNRSEGVMNIHELQYHSQKDSLTQTTYKLGFWNHSQDIETKSAYKSRSQGIYFIADKVFSRESDLSQGLNGFVQAGYSLTSLNPVSAYLGGGFVYQGIFPKRDDDVVGLAVAHSFFSNLWRTVKNETAIELTYHFNSSRAFSIKPNVQYIIQPAVQNNIPNALMGLVRLNYSW